MINFKQIYKSYRGRFAVDNLSLKIEEGELFVLLGESGSGKTTSLKMVNRLIKPDAGQVLLNNIDISEIDATQLRKGIGYVMQFYGLFPHYTVKENIAIVPVLLNWDKEKINRRSAELMAVFGLDPIRYLHRFPAELSGGQQQRIGMIRALMASPPVLLMDEPLGALDPVTRNSIRNEFKTLEELKNKTILMVTHDIQEAFILADRIGLMFEGRLIQVGKPIDFLLHPASKIVTDFFKDQHFSLMLECITFADLLPELKSIREFRSIPLSTKHFIELQDSARKLLEIFTINSDDFQHIEWKSVLGAEFLILNKELFMNSYFRYLKKRTLTFTNVSS